MRILWLLLMLCLWLPPARATTAHPEKVNCPSCKTPFTVAVMMSSNNAGGMDRDFLEHAGGSQPVILSIACCPKCHYANSVDALLEKPKVPEGIKKFLHSPEFHFPAYDKGYPARQVPAWAAYDARAQIVTRTGKAKPMELTNLYIKAAWCVRFEENPFSQARESLDESARKTLYSLLEDPKKEPDNRSDLVIQMANDLLGRLPSLTPPQDRVAAIWAAYALRDHGENDTIAKAWPILKAYFPDLEPAVQKSAELEKHYQALALQALNEAALKSEPKVNLVYLAGELNRRLGNLAEARTLFEKAETMNPAEHIKQWIVEQKARCGP